MAKHSRNKTAQSIILAALECLERDGLEGMTIRTIAQQAGVNVAAVNYHFGSKEVLLTEVLELASRNAFLDFDQWVTTPEATTPLSAASNKELRQQLEQFANHILDGLSHYPNTSKVVLHELMFGHHPDLKRRFEQFLGKLEQNLRALHGDEAAWRSTQFLSAMVSLCLLPNSLQHVVGISLVQPQTRQRVVALLV